MASFFTSLWCLCALLPGDYLSVEEHGWPSSLLVSCYCQSWSHGSLILQCTHFDCNIQSCQHQNCLWAVLIDIQQSATVHLAGGTAGNANCEAPPPIIHRPSQSLGKLIHQSIYAAVNASHPLSQRMLPRKSSLKVLATVAVKQKSFYAGCELDHSLSVHMNS